MKLHLPLSLYKSLLLLMSACAVTAVQAGLMHQDVDIQVYADFGQNKGRYVTSAHANELVQFIRTQEGGIAIPYADGSAPFYITNEQGMINFAGTGDNGAYAAIAPNAMVTVRHNGSNDASYGEREVGSEHAINYSAIDIKIDEKPSVFRLLPIQDNGDAYDYSIQRQSKIVTDAVYNPLTGVDDVSAFKGQYLYHSGAGLMGVYKEETGYSSLAGAYAYTIGGINTITDVWNGSGNNSVISSPGYGDGRGACQENPLPNGLQGGDSGSPVYIYNASTGSYEYVAAQQSGHKQGGDGWSQARGNVKWTRDTLESFNARVTMSPTTSTVYLNAIDTPGETKTDGTNSATLYSGAVKDSTGNELVRYNGVQSSLNTWGDLSTVKDLQNWYAYDSNAYLQRSDAELFFSNNLVFSSNAAENTIVLNDTVDLGIGYAEFNGGKFTITSEDRESNQFNHAGYVINEGAEVHLKLVNPDNYMTEWRKAGAGALYIDGNGNTNALLNVGGSGTTYLQQTGGYAAYNVLASSGATVEIADTDQIKRDFTFGAGGGVLNMNGKSMEWNNSNGTDADGFTIHALDEQAVVANLSRGTTTELTWTQGDSQTFLGSFRDNGKDSCLQFVYDGGAEGRLTMHSIKTKLTAPGSGITVNSGTLVLAGSYTVHGKGSATGRNGERLFRENDWHYADATAPVTVNGGTFELGSHARLIGDVTVAENATYVMREGVAHALEYVEGGVALEETSKYADYFGHKGHVILNGGKLAVQFNDGVDTNTTYGYNVSGAGDITVDAGNDGGSFTFSGAITATGKKTVTGGTLLLSGAAAVDNGSGKWLVESAGQMSVDNIDMIDSASTGTLVLSRDTESYLDRSNHSQMLLGAQAGKEVQYGAVGTQETLRDWNLGGAGSLVVNYVVSGSEALTVDGRGHSTGSVKLQQIADDYSGTINVQSEGGRMVLDVGNVELETTVNVRNGGVLRATDAVVSGESNTVELYGNLEYDSFTVRDGATLNLRVGGQGRLDADNAVTISGGGVMRLWQQTLADKVNLENGGIMYGKGGTIGETASVMATEGKGTLNAGSGTFAIDKGTIGAAEGATLRLENGTFNIYSKDINSAGGTLELACSSVYLGYRQNEVTQTIGGTLKVANDLTICTKQGDPAQWQGMTFDINHLHIDARRLTLETGSGEFRHRYNIASLTGSGTIHWKNNMSYFYKGPSLMILTGDNDFSGTLIVDQKCAGGSMQHVGLSHENAAKGMVINLWGASDSRPGLAVSAKTARVAGIGGTVNTFVYAGAIKTDWNGDNPASTAHHTLVIDTKGADHVYNGTLLGDAGHGLNLIKDGAGSQTFTNSENVVHDISALQGSLVFTNAPTIYGDMGVAQGATLQIGTGELSLDAGKTLRVLEGTKGNVATLNNTLVFNGGGLCFSAYDAEQYALSTQGLSKGANYESLQITFANESSIEVGTRYMLASGDWSSYADSISIAEGVYTQAAVQANTTGLSVVFALKDDYSYWDGQSVDLAAGSKWVFNHESGTNAAVLRGSASVAVFDTDSDFAVNAADNGELDIARIDKLGAGSLAINATINADTLRVAESGSITGSGLLQVDRMSVDKEAQTTITDLDVVVQSELVASGTLRVGKGANLQLKDAASGHIQLLSGAEMAVSATALPANLTLGEKGAEGSVFLRMAGSELALNGDVEVQGRTSLAVYGSGNLAFNSGLNELSSLELKSGVGLEQTTAMTTHLVLDGGRASAKGGDILRGDITVKNSGTFTFTEADDILRHSQDGKSYGKTITVSGGTLAFGNTRQTMASWNLVLSDGATVTGDGGSYDGKKAALDFNSNDSTICAASGESTISAITRLRDGNNLNYNVSKDATLTVSGVIHADGAAGKGSITKEGDGTLVLTGANTYADTTTVNGGTLSASVGGALGTSDLVINDGGTVLIGGNGHQLLASDVTVNDGGTLRFTGEGADMMKYSASSLTVAGGTVDFGTTRQTMGVRKLILSDNATISGVGNATYGAMDFNQKDSTISVTSGKDNTISAVTCLRARYDNGNVNLNYDVSEDATLTVSGLIHADGVSGCGSITKQGEGTLVLSAANTHGGTTTVSEGTLSVTKAGALGSSRVVVEKGATLKINTDADYTVGNTLEIDGKLLAGGSRFNISHVGKLLLGDGASVQRENTQSLWLKGTLEVVHEATASFVSPDDIHLSYQNGDNKGVINLSSNSKLDMQLRRLQFYKGASINLEDGAKMSLTQTEGESSESVEFSNVGAEEATLTSSNVDTNTAMQYRMSSDEFTLRNGHLASKSTNEAELNNVLENSSVENAGAGLLKVNNANNTLTGVHATGGNVTVQNIASLELKELEIAAEKTITAAAVVVSELAKLEAGATLAADLTLASGATVELGGTMTLSGALELQTGLTLSGTVLDIVKGLAVGESYTLFNGVESLDLKDSVTLFNMRSLAAQTVETLSYGSLMEEEQVAAADYFSNLTGNSGLVLSYNVTAGTVTITNTQAVPEPTTATLSLLALAGLCARRRRR